MPIPSTGLLAPLVLASISFGVIYTFITPFHSIPDQNRRRPIGNVAHLHQIVQITERNTSTGKYQMSLKILPHSLFVTAHPAGHIVTKFSQLVLDDGSVIEVRVTTEVRGVRQWGDARAQRNHYEDIAVAAATAAVGEAIAQVWYVSYPFLLLHNLNLICFNIVDAVEPDVVGMVIQQDETNMREGI